LLIKFETFKKAAKMIYNQYGKDNAKGYSNFMGYWSQNDWYYPVTSTYLGDGKYINAEVAPKIKTSSGTVTITIANLQNYNWMATQFWLNYSPT
jgi:hypothetical protein